MDPSPMTSVLIRRGKFGHRHIGRRPCEDGDRDWSDASTSQGMSGTVNNHQKLGESTVQILPQNLQRESIPILDF